MNELRGLPPVPAERDFPRGRLEERRAVLVQLVEAELQPVPARGLLRSLRAWVASLSVILVLLVLAASAFVAGRGSAARSRVAIQTAAVVGSGSIVACLKAR